MSFSINSSKLSKLVKSYKKSFGTNQEVRVYPKAWLEMFFGNLDTALKLLEKEVKTK